MFSLGPDCTYNVPKLCLICSGIPVAGVFIAIGAESNNTIFAPELQLDKSGYVIAGEDCHTNLPGVFAVGDARTKEVRQLVTAAANGAVSALAAKEYLDSI